MVGTLAPKGEEEAQMKICFVRDEEAPGYFEMEEELIFTYAKVAGGIYQLAKI